jgi:nucleoside-diphosphate-sugar epimerase
MEPRALVVGGTGYVGKFLVAALVREGWTVRVISRGLQRAADVDRGPDVEVTYWDGSLDPLIAAISPEPPDIIVLLSAHFVAEHGPADVEPLVDANIRRAALVMEAARVAGVPRFVMAGSFWEARAEDDGEAVDLYAATRRAAKELFRYYATACAWRAAYLRVGDVYGPADPRQKLFSHLRRAAQTGLPLQMSPGRQLLDLVNVEDAVAAFRAAMTSTMEPGPSGLVEYGAFTGAPMALRDVVALYEQVVGRPVPVVWGARPYRAREVMIPRQIPGPPGWTAAIPLADGLRAMELQPGGLLHP